MVLQILFSNGSLPWPEPPTIELPLHIRLRLGLYLSNWPFLHSLGPSMDASADASQPILEYFVLDQCFVSGSMTAHRLALAGTRPLTA
jgi:hypothetical protein